VNRYRSIGELPIGGPGRAIAIGAFDGVHLGHRAIIRLAVEAAKRRGVPSMVLTFDPNPLAVLRPELKTTVLTPSEVRARLIADQGVDELLEIPFTKAFSQVRWERFCEILATPPLGAQTIAVGRNFRFGQGGEGTAGMLRDAGRQRGIEVEIPALVTSPDGKPVSSTRVRRLIAQGDIEDANTLLGRAHCLEGTVIHGDGRGAGLGIPTANIAVSGRAALPGRGVYAGRVTVAGETWSAAINVGMAPTFRDAHDIRLEALLIDYPGAELYDQRASVSFVAHLRGETRFASAEALVAQIHKDVDRARDLARGAADPLC
jgi:riboflavin kinase / FMN adenylyltransferase